MNLRPFSVLVYAITKLSCDYGIMITASHNPAVYNGYKVYGKHGYQIIGSELDSILKEQERFDYFDEVDVDDSKIIMLDDEIKKRFFYQRLIHLNLRELTRMLNRIFI